MLYLKEHVGRPVPVLAAAHVDLLVDGRIAPRSGLASKNFIDTGAGVIDADYRGQVKVLLFNHAETDFQIKIGDRIAQLVLERVCHPAMSYPWVWYVNRGHPDLYSRYCGSREFRRECPRRRWVWKHRLKPIQLGPPQKRGCWKAEYYIDCC